MQATVTRVSDGLVRVVVRMSSTQQTLDGRHNDLLPGDKVEVKRQTNNPYLVRAKPSK